MRRYNKNFIGQHVVGRRQKILSGRLVADFCVSLVSLSLASLQPFCRLTENFNINGVGTGGSGGSMNRAPELLGPPSSGATEKN